MEMRLVARRVLARTRLEPVDARPEKVERRGITMVPARGVRVVQRRAPSPRV
jgi:cytochrome P450